VSTTSGDRSRRQRRAGGRVDGNGVSHRRGQTPRLRADFLDFLRTRENDLGTTAGARRKRIRDLAKALNLRGGVTLLDSLLPGEITGILTEELAAAAGSASAARVAGGR